MFADVLFLVVAGTPPQADPTPPETFGPDHPVPAQTLFSSSFEAAGAQPTWTDTVETDPAGHPKAAGVDGALATGIPGSVNDQIVDVTANAENTGGGEVKENPADGDASTKWLTFTTTGWLQFTFDAPKAVVTYALTSANDDADRDPRDWTLRARRTARTGRPWTPAPASLRRAAPDEARTTFANPAALPVLPARRHRTTAARPSSSSPTCSSPRPTRRRRRRADMRSVDRARPDRLAHRQGAAPASPARGRCSTRDGTPRRPRLLVQQDLRRRLAVGADHPAVLRDLPRAGERRPATTPPPTPPSTWPSPTAPT